MDPLRDLEAQSNPGADWPLSALLHEETKLSPRRAQAFVERVESHAGEGGAHPSSMGGTTGRRSPALPTVELPAPPGNWRGGGLYAALRRRRTHRGPWGSDAMSLQQAGTLLGLGLGVTGTLPAPPGPLEPSKARSWPSAGGLYGLEFYLHARRCAGVRAGVYHHEAEAHRLQGVSPLPDAAGVRRLLHGVEHAGDAAAWLVVTAVFERTQAKYGERGYRFLLLEAGHAAQNVLLIAEALGLAAMPVGGFDEDALAAAMGLEGGRESPVHVLLLGAKG